MEINKCVCGKSTVMDRWVSGYDSRMQKYRVECECGICGPWRYNEQDAIAAWNALPRENNSNYRRALDILGVPTQSQRDPDVAPPLKITVAQARNAMEIING